MAGLRRLRAGAPKSRIAILSDQENPQLMIGAVNSGAQAFIPKRSEDDPVIGARLDLALSTVKSHVTAIFKALDVTNPTQAVLALSEVPEKAMRRVCG